MQRVPVISKEGYPLMPTKPSRARRWLKSGKAVIWRNKLNVFAIQLTFDADCDRQPVVVGIDPGKLFTGIAVQSKQCTHWLGHLFLPFQKIKDRLEQRRMMRRGRRGRRINRNIPFSQRAHRQARFDNRRSKKIPPSIKANRDLEYRVLNLLSNIFPLLEVVAETVKARGDKAFSPVMVAQKWQLSRLRKEYMVQVKEGWETAQLRTQLGLKKQKTNKADAVIETHAVDGIALACSEFVKYQITSLNSRGWVGSVNITHCPLTVIRRPPISRRQLHLMVPSKGNKRRKYGGTVTLHGLRKGDYVEATQGKKTVKGWVSGDTKTQVSVSDASWKRLGQFSKNKVRLIHRSIGLIVTGAKVGGQSTLSATFRG
ncbi:MAG: RRXRR domain-containing protein [Cyanobacteria bacterium J06636_27]